MSILRPASDGVYWILSMGRMAAPMTASAAMISSTENAGMPLRDGGMGRGTFIGGVGKSRNKPAG